MKSGIPSKCVYFLSSKALAGSEIPKTDARMNEWMNGGKHQTFKLELRPTQNVQKPQHKALCPESLGTLIHPPQTLEKQLQGSGFATSDWLLGKEDPKLFCFLSSGLVCGQGGYIACICKKQKITKQLPNNLNPLQTDMSRSTYLLSLWNHWTRTIKAQWSLLL